MEGVTCPCWGWGWGPGFLTLSPPPPLPLLGFLIPTARCLFECSCTGPGPRPSACSPLHVFLFRLVEHPAGMRRGLSCSCPTSSSWALWRAGFSRPPATWGSCLPGRCSLGFPLQCTSFLLWCLPSRCGGWGLWCQGQGLWVNRCLCSLCKEPEMESLPPGLLSYRNKGAS